jgi:hypothetical protein
VEIRAEISGAVTIRLHPIQVCIFYRMPRALIFQYFLMPSLGAYAAHAWQPAFRKFSIELCAGDGMLFSTPKFKPEPQLTTTIIHSQRVHLSLFFDRTKVGRNPASVF